MQKIEYIPDTGFILNSHILNWYSDRAAVRQALGNSHAEDDSTTDMSEFFGGDNSYNIVTKRDVYTDFGNSENYFFFYYNNEDKFIEAEIHSGFIINIKGLDAVFGEDIHEVVDRLKFLDKNYSETEEGNYLFPGLKITVASSESMGVMVMILAIFMLRKM